MDCPGKAAPRCPRNTARRLSLPGKVIAVEHAQLVARQSGTRTQMRHHRGKPLGRALHQSAQDAWLGMVDLVIQRGQRDRQMLHLPRRRMQRRTQPQRNQRHQLHNCREHQLARILALALGLEHRVNPVWRKRPLQSRPRHHACRRVLFKARQNNRPNRTGTSR